ncbi:uncharacterized protein LACBIDRAFT_302618 [Laccaria bicolor S238N-H82]|uniref:Predicted protein n=1 Tax=Laccaria bicolor (strain S238N-H82 / ATCC MYA-4686) TaxID=486041 RepID=B0DI03_LACBS|nr:uncharacterized protein LACBIDRAFT_302618 [Laccaria bicolor S238N-H82]EDR05923.1 predicted protein [Laccaria bicolor S238N-H82]|eukprot:XP_001883599.1 predicted protein [Laccaria bicolor S238N-H82]
MLRTTPDPYLADSSCKGYGHEVRQMKQEGFDCDLPCITVLLHLRMLSVPGKWSNKRR